MYTFSSWFDFYSIDSLQAHRSDTNSNNKLPSVFSCLILKRKFAFSLQHELNPSTLPLQLLHVSCVRRNKQNIYEITPSFWASLVHKPFSISPWRNVCEKIQTSRFPHISVYCDLRSIWKPYGWGRVSATSYNLHQQTELLIISPTTSAVFCLLTTNNLTTTSQELKLNLRTYSCFQTVWSAAIALGFREVYQDMFRHKLL